MPSSQMRLLFGVLLVQQVTADHISLMQIKAQSLRSNTRDDTILPQVETVLADSSKTLNGIFKQTSQLHAALVQKQQEFRSKLVHVKEEYEAKLNVQNKENVELKMDISRIVDSIKKTRTESNLLRNNSAELMHNNSLLRVQLKKLETKLQTAKAFASLALNSTDDASSSELVILSTPAPVHRQEPPPNALAALGEAETVEQAMEFMVYGHHGKSPSEADDEADDTDAPVGLLQVGSAVDALRKLDYPESMALLSALTAGLDQVQAEYGKAQEQLKHQFQEHSDAASQEHSALLARKKRVTNRLEALTSIKEKLQMAYASLQKTHEQLGQRIKGLKMFLVRVGNTDQ